MQHCRGRPMLGFICSPLSASDLREHWQNLLEIETEDSEPYLLRFADTRVYRHWPGKRRFGAGWLPT